MHFDKTGFKKLPLMRTVTSYKHAVTIGHRSQEELLALDNVCPAIFGLKFFLKNNETVPFSIPNLQHLNVYDRTVSCFQCYFLTKTSVKCTDCLKLWDSFV